MKNIYTLLALTISFSMNAQVSTVGTTASGAVSTAMGGYTTASGNHSTAMGDETTASGYASTAMGEETTASGDYSTAMGYGTIASDRGSLVIGQYNLLGSTVTNNAIQFSTENTAFVIGNGELVTSIGQINRSDALTVLFDGTTNIAGSVTATSFIGDGSQLTNLPSSSPFSLNTASGTGIQSPTNTASGYDSTASGYESTASGSSSRAMGRVTTASGYASTAMGRVPTASGYASTAMGNETEASGDYSTAIGENTTASGENSTAMGDSSTASGIGSTAMGSYTIASGIGSTAMGAVTIASGANSTAIGYGTTASETFTTAMGYDTTASGPYSTAMGGETTASGNYSTAIGAYSAASGICSTAMGAVTIASGDSSTAIGSGTTASDYASLVIGRFNSSGSSVTNSATSFNTANTAFVIGNGTGPGPEASDALTVLFDGTTTIAGDLSINSDARLKANIISLGSTLAKVLQIDGKSYTMKKDENKKQKIGVLAQDIEKVFPELVSESNGVKSVNYQGLVPVLINALKEQDAKMNEQQSEIDTYRDEVSELKEIVQALVSRE
jgi:hypothetical protein